MYVISVVDAVMKVYTMFLENKLALIMYRNLGGGVRMGKNRTLLCQYGIKNIDYENPQEITVLFLKYQCMYPPLPYRYLRACASLEIIPKKGGGVEKRGVEMKTQFHPRNKRVHTYEKIKYINELDNSLSCLFLFCVFDIFCSLLKPYKKWATSGTPRHLLDPLMFMSTN